jgi:hypothetical protein
MLEKNQRFYAQSYWHTKSISEHNLARELLNMIRGVPGAVFHFEKDLFKVCDLPSPNNCSYDFQYLFLI